MKRNTYSYFVTDVPNALGGYFCYDNLSDAIKFCNRKVYVRTCVRRENNIGVEVKNALACELWMTLIYEKK